VTLAQIQRFNFDQKVPHHLAERLDSWFMHQCVPVCPVARAARGEQRNRLAGMAPLALFPKQRYVSLCPSIVDLQSKLNVVDVSLGI
jgi:hypothetical protein